MLQWTHREDIIVEIIFSTMNTQIGYCSKEIIFCYEHTEKILKQRNYLLQWTHREDIIVEILFALMNTQRECYSKDIICCNEHTERML